MRQDLGAMELEPVEPRRERPRPPVGLEGEMLRPNREAQASPRPAEPVREGGPVPADDAATVDLHRDHVDLRAADEFRDLEVVGVAIDDVRRRDL